MLSGTLMSLDAPSTPVLPMDLYDIKPIKVFSILYGVFIILIFLSKTWRHFKQCLQMCTPYSVLRNENEPEAFKLVIQIGTSQGHTISFLDSL